MQSKRAAPPFAGKPQRAEGPDNAAAATRGDVVWRYSRRGREVRDDVSSTGASEDPRSRSARAMTGTPRARRATRDAHADLSSAATPNAPLSRCGPANRHDGPNSPIEVGHGRRRLGTGAGQRPRKSAVAPGHRRGQRDVAGDADYRREPTRDTGGRGDVGSKGFPKGGTSPKE